MSGVRRALLCGGCDCFLVDFEHFLGAYVP
jgi:hypothetical protein